VRRQSNSQLPIPNAQGKDQQHYSYAVYADPAMADRFDAMRFGGPIGELVAATQEQQVAEFLAPIEGRRVLDVGTGTGRAAIALAKRGADVTGVDASAEMLAAAERRARQAGLQVTFRRDDVHHLAFADRAFDSVVCLRVLMHTPDWTQSLGELCRVAQQRIVLDFPAAFSAAAVESAARRLVKPFAPRTEAYRVFSVGAIEHELSVNGFRLVAQHRQFVLPIALHKRVGSRGWTERVEAVLSRAGLLARVGSPVTILAERCAS